MLNNSTPNSPRAVRMGAAGVSATLIAAVAAVSLTGCNSMRHDSVHAPSLRGNLTPELATLAERSDDVANNMAITNDTLGRQFTQDLGSVWYTDRPSRLHRGPSPR